MNIHERIGMALSGASLIDDQNVIIEHQFEEEESRPRTEMIRDLLAELDRVGLTIVERDPFESTSPTHPTPFPKLDITDRWYPR